MQCVPIGHTVGIIGYQHIGSRQQTVSYLNLADCGNMCTLTNIAMITNNNFWIEVLLLKFGPCGKLDMAA